MGLLTVIVVVPFIAALVIMALPRRREPWIKPVALAATGLNLALSLFLVFDYLRAIGLAGAPDKMEAAKWRGLQAGHTIGAPAPLFPRKET